jgi:hypothetical protein
MPRAWEHEANDEAVRNFFARWDPAWRWILILGLREMRRDPTHLGRLASAEANGTETWADESYAYGPLAAGITAAAVNEAAQHCEDLFALLRFLREPTNFAKSMGAYAAGRVIGFGRKLVDVDDAAASRMFLVPPPDLVAEGLRDAADPEGSVTAIEAGRSRLAETLRNVARFYERFKDFHVQYKHGLKLPLRPFGEPTEAAIEERKAGMTSPLFMWSTEPVAAAVGRQEQAMMFVLGPHQQAHLRTLVEQRNVMRLQLAHEVDLDELADMAHAVMRLLQFAATNRSALGEVVDGDQHFVLPGEARWEQLHVYVRLERALSLEDFRDPPSSLR